MKLMHARHAIERGFTVDDYASGRPRAYKGPRFAPVVTAPCYTELEEQLLDMLHEMKVYAPRPVLDNINKKLDELLR